MVKVRLWDFQEFLHASPKASKLWRVKKLSHVKGRWMRFPRLRAFLAYLPFNHEPSPPVSRSTPRKSTVVLLHDAYPTQTALHPSSSGYCNGMPVRQHSGKDGTVRPQHKSRGETASEGSRSSP